MGQLVEFLYYLSNSAGDYYYLDANNDVQTTSTETPIEYDPKTWRDKAVSWERGFDFWGVFTNMTNPLEFTRDGAKILRYVYLNDGINADLILTIERLESSTQVYNTYWEGELDFTQYQDNDNFVSIIALDGSYNEKLRSRRSNEYEIDIDTNPYFYVKMDGITLKSQLNYITVTEPGPTFPADMYDNISFIEVLVPSVRYLDGDGLRLVGKSLSPEGGTRSLISNTIVAFKFEDMFFESIRNSDYTMDFDFRIAVRNQGKGPGASSQDPIKIEIRLNSINKSSGGMKSTVLFTTPTFQPSNGSTTIYNINFTTPTFVTFPGERLGISINVITAGGVGNNLHEYDLAVELGDITMNFETKLDTTYIKALRPVEVFSELAENINEGTIGTSITNEISNHVVTSFDAIRGLDGSKIKTSFDDFWESYNYRFNLATFYTKTTDTHSLVPKSTVFQSGNIFTINEEVKDFKVMPFKELLPKSVKVGEQDHKLSEVNAKDSFINPFEFESNVIRSDETFDMLTPYFSDQYVIEITRANLNGKTTTDSDFDNDNAILHIESSPAGTHNGRDYYQLYRDNTLTVTGIISPDDAFNIDLSPKRNLLRHGNIFSSIFHNMGPTVLKFISALRNDQLSTTGGGTTITENADVTMADIDLPLFLPYVFEFTTIQPIPVKQLIEANPFGIIQFPYRGENYTGFIISASDNPASKSAQTLKLLSTTTNTITNLIR